MKTWVGVEVNKFCVITGFLFSVYQFILIILGYYTLAFLTVIQAILLFILGTIFYLPVLFDSYSQFKSKSKGGVTK